MKPVTRYYIACLLGVIYALISVSPVARLALRPLAVHHAISGECSGDCAICGCSLERRASHTCCCWQKKEQEQEKLNRQNADCCRKNKQSKTTVTIATCRCGSETTQLPWVAEDNELMPCQFHETQPIMTEMLLEQHQSHRMVSRDHDPPDPPPKLGISC